MQDFILPDIGEGIVECEVVKWLVAQGETITEDQAVVEVMTDKALVEIPAKYSGVVTKLYYVEGDIAKVHSPLFEMQIDGEGEGELQLTVVANEPNDEVKTTDNQLDSSPNDRGGIKPASGKALASPAVRRLARELEIDLSQVNGSGEKGRVLKEDLSGFSSSTTQPSSAVPLVGGGTRVEPIRGIQAAMAKHMMHSVFTVPHFSVSEEIEMDSLILAREQLKPSFEKEGVKLSFMPFFIKAMSLALQQFPVINSQVNADCSQVTYFDDHNIGVAVDSKVGLVVPNIKGVQNLSLFDVAKRSNELVDLARQGKLSNSDLKGGTISISNIGVLGGTVATPVINAPESAIVALGKIQRLPRFGENDVVKAVNIMHVSWSGDHRIIDGATMVRFNNLWKSYLENPLTMLANTR
ncbi:MAG: 2-oxo acid dehydrogenase subunit E2 [Paraglaciecola sp.]|uniref:2-oxo acid dehydrogenase subunit E2 n=1 Tax=Paraglaciecola sp. TaxID=1920173 RepID=UPI00329759C7